MPELLGDNPIFDAIFMPIDQQDGSTRPLIVPLHTFDFAFNSSNGLNLATIDYYKHTGEHAGKICNIPGEGGSLIPLPVIIIDKKPYTIYEAHYLTGNLLTFLNPNPSIIYTPIPNYAIIEGALNILENLEQILIEYNKLYEPIFTFQPTPDNPELPDETQSLIGWVDDNTFAYNIADPTSYFPTLDEVIDVTYKGVRMTTDHLLLLFWLFSPKLIENIGDRTTTYSHLYPECVYEYLRRRQYISYNLNARLYPRTEPLPSLDNDRREYQGLPLLSMEHFRTTARQGTHLIEQEAGYRKKNKTKRRNRTITKKRRKFTKKSKRIYNGKYKKTKLKKHNK